MSEPSFCAITLSYEPDFAICRLLAESIDRFATSSFHHYIVVDRKDFKLFKQLENSHRTILTVESILPWWIQKVPWLNNGWVSLQTLPLRNWLIQQIVKLAIAEFVSEDILVFLDSDVFFVKKFDLREFIRENQIRLFRIIHPASVLVSPSDSIKTELKWHDTANALLGIPPIAEISPANPLCGYVGNVITWERDCVLLLHRHIEEVNQKYWLKAIAEKWHFSEYTLYGNFVDRILRQDSPHYWDDSRICHEYWGTKPLTQEEVQKFRQKIAPESFAMMVSAKSKTPLHLLRPLTDNTRDQDSQTPMTLESRISSP